MIGLPGTPNSLDARVGPQSGVAVPSAVGTIGQGSVGVASNAIFTGDVKTVTLQVVNETATPLTTLKIQACNGAPDAPDAEWQDLHDFAGLGANANKSVVLVDKPYKWMRLRAADGAATATVKIRWSGQ